MPARAIPAGHCGRPPRAPALFSPKRLAGAAAWGLLLLLLVVVLALAAAAARGGRRPELGARRGGAEAAPAPRAAVHVVHHAHELSRGALAARLGEARAFVPPGSGRTGGGARPGGRPAAGAPADRRDWTEFASWQELSAAPQWRRYLAERQAVLKRYPSDWGAVRADLAGVLRAPPGEAPREWAGSINLVGGVPRVASKVPSPFAMGENVGPGASAAIPADVVSEISGRPAMFFYHTHPAPVSPLVSSIDAAGAVLDCYMGHYAAHLVISPDAIIMYGLLPRTQAQIWDNPHPYLVAVRKSFDVYAAIEGLRSRGDFYSARDLERIMRDLGLLYVVYPVDSFADLYYNSVFVPSRRADLGEMGRQLAQLAAAQDDAFPGPAARPRPPGPGSGGPGREESLPAVESKPAGA